MIINNCFKVRSLILTAVLIISLTFINHASALPDFVVPEITGPTTIIRDSGGETTIPIEVVVGNQGKDTARLYGRNSIVYKYESGNAFMAPFITPNETNFLFFARKAWIDPGARVTLNGTVKVPSPRLNEVISLSAIVDWCKSPLGTEPCRMPESNERNNRSTPIPTKICTPGPLGNPNHVQGITDLGPLPAGLLVTWPAPPSIERGVHIRTLQEFRDLYDNQEKSRTRFYFHTNIDYIHAVNVDASDVEIVIMPGFKLHNIVLNSPVHRVKISGGGEVGRIRASIYVPITTPEDDGYITDVLIDSITLDNRDEGEKSGRCERNANECDGVTFRGVRRGAVINSSISSLVYPVAAWEHSSTSSIPHNKDIIIANNRLHSAEGTQATVRLQNSENTVTVHNRLESTYNTTSKDWPHNYRIHGLSSNGGVRYAYAACNLLVNSGAMIGERGYMPIRPGEDSPTEDVRHFWFNSNQFHQSANSLYQMGRTPVVAVHDAEIRGNLVYSGSHDCFYLVDCSDAPAPPVDWVIRDNKVEAPP